MVKFVVSVFIKAIDPKLTNRTYMSGTGAIFKESGDYDV
jgi:hypothetical protein